MIVCPCCASKIEDAILTDELHKLRDGEVVLYKRPESSRWQARFKLPSGEWRNASTKRANLDEAKHIAGEFYDEARFRVKLGQSPVSRRFRDVARLAIAEMDKATAAGRGKSIYKDYTQALEKYFIPYFGNKHIDRLTDADMLQFDAWRIQQMNKAPAASTLLNHNAAIKKVFDIAIANGWAVKGKLPELRATGKKTQRRPDFTYEDWRTLCNKMRYWVKAAKSDRSLQLRELLWDYVLILAHTGIRTGTEAKGLKWSHLRWEEKKGDGVYLAISVKGKTGTRELVARHGAQQYFERIQKRFPDLAKMTFDELLKSKCDEYVFRMRNGRQTTELYHAFEDLLNYAGVLTDAQGEKRTLYSLRHMYATMRLMIDGVDIHSLAKQMGTSVAMIEKHYSHLTPLMVADKLAGKRFVKPAIPEPEGTSATAKPAGKKTSKKA